MELIKVNQTENGTQTVLASELHRKLQIKTEFSHWIKRMLTYGFIENTDYWIIEKASIVTVPNVCTSKMTSKKRRGGHNQKDYVLTVDSAKSIAMLQRSEIGRKIRAYFIEMEKHYKEIATPQQIAELYKRLNNLEAQQIDYTNDWSVDRFLYTNKIRSLFTQADRQRMGKLCAKEYRNRTGEDPKKVPHPSYTNGQNVYPYEIVNKIYQEHFRNK